MIHVIDANRPDEARDKLCEEAKRPEDWTLDTTEPGTRGRTRFVFRTIDAPEPTAQSTGNASLDRSRRIHGHIYTALRHLRDRLKEAGAGSCSVVVKVQPDGSWTILTGYAAWRAIDRAGGAHRTIGVLDSDEQLSALAGALQTERIEAATAYNLAIQSPTARNVAYVSIEGEPKTTHPVKAESETALIRKLWESYGLAPTDKPDIYKRSA